jgi:hypothetical protein
MGRGSGKQVLVRILAVTAAMALVGAFALATMLPPMTSLAELVAMLDNPTLLALPQMVHGNAPQWVWDWLVLPLLMRPVWLLPAAIGVVLGGLAITLQGPGAPKSPRWKM